MNATELRAEYIRLAARAAAGDRAVTDEQLGLAAQRVAVAELRERNTAAKATVTVWSPPDIPHVVGRWTQRTFDESGLPEEQLVEAECQHPGCGAQFKRHCASGHVREHVMRFALVHLHRDVFFTRPKNPEGKGHR